MVPFSVLLATTSQGIHRVEKTGGAWHGTKHLHHLDVRVVTLSPEGTALAGTQGKGIWRSDDGGSSWAASGLEGQIVKSIGFCADQPQVVYAGTKPPYLYRSDDSGRTWRELESFRGIRGRWFWRQPAERPSTPYAQAIACSPVDPDVVLVGMEAGATVRSTDGGRTWSNHLKGACRDCHTLAFHPDGIHVFQGGGSFGKVAGPGVGLSADRGTTWSRPDEGLDRRYGWAVAVDPERPNQVFVSLSPGPMKAHSNDDAQAAIFRCYNGKAWRLLEGGLPQPLDHMPYALLTHPTTPGYVLAGLSNGEMWETNDLGETWALAETRVDAVHRSLVGI